MKKFLHGQSLFEVVLALGLATLIIVAIVSLATNSIRNTSFSRDKTLSTRYAQEATEWLRGQRDEDWDTFSANVIFCPAPPYTQCLDTLSWGDCGACASDELIDDRFKREVSFADITADSVSMEVTVYWSDSQGLHEVRNGTTLTDWRSQF
jgi:Tfp pilus assembly protein PilV